MLKSLTRLGLSLAAAAALSLALVSCGESSAPSGTPPAGSTQASYKCAGCGKTQSVATSAAAPSC